MNDRKTISAIALCVLFYLGYSNYLNKKYGSARQQAEQAENTAAPIAPASDPNSTNATPATNAASPAASSTSTPDPAIPALTAEQLRIDVQDRSFLFSQSDSSIASATLNHYKADLSKDSPPVELIDGKLLVQGIIGSADLTTFSNFQGLRDGAALRFNRTQAPWLISQEFRPAQNNEGLDLNVSFTNTSNQPMELTAGVLIKESFSPQKKSSGFLPSGPPDIHSTLVHFAGSLKREEGVKVCEETSPIATGTNEVLEFIGSDSHYFLKAFAPGINRLNFKVERSLTQTPGTCTVSYFAFQPFGQVQPGQSIVIPFRTYFGPKSVAALDTFGASLRDSINLGWFSIIAHPLLVTIKAFQKVVINYGIAIIIVTMLLKFLFYPLTKQAAVSMKRMQVFQPEMNRIREKYKDDPPTQQRELMKFMGQNKINPAKGCLPILPQIPVFIALYNVLSQSIELRHTPFYGWIRDLSAHDPYYVTPVILGLCMFAQQRLTPQQPGMDKTQQRIMQMMPIIFSFMMISLPSGLVLYMLTNTIISILQQQWLNRRLATAVAVPQMS